jgi:hypothetical protein
MGLVSLILLVLLGVLGIASWLKGRQPKFGSGMGKLESVEGWIGLVGLIWGIVLLLRWLQALQFVGYAPGFVLVALIVALVVIAISLILALPQLRNLFGANGFTNKLGDVAGKLEPYKVALGFTCLILALYMLITMSSLRAY